MPCACTIAGSDSGGGAGIQADLKTFAALGVWGCSVITAVTAQNPLEVTGSWTLPAEAVRAQIEAVSGEFRCGAVKTGMLADEETIRTVVRYLSQEISLVVDPVMVSTSGSRLLEEEAEEAILSLLIPGTTLLTPNLPEACVLTGMPAISSEQEMAEAAGLLQDMGADAVLVKGGHGRGDEVVDILLEADGRHTIFRHPRFPYEVHGSGCCLSAAIAAYIASGYGIQGACKRATGFCSSAIEHAFPSESGRMSVNPGWQGSGNI